MSGDLVVYVHTNRLIYRQREEWLKGKTNMWDVFLDDMGSKFEQQCMFSYILQLICLSTYFFEYKCNIYKKLYVYITDASRTLRFRGFLENDASDAPAS
jgi:hypothetical protein